MHLVVTTVSLVFNNIQNCKAVTIATPLKVKCFPIFYSLFFFFFPSNKRTVFITHLCQMCFPYFTFWVWKGSGPLGPSSTWLFLRTLLTQKTLDWCLVQAQASGWQGPNLCHVNPHWMAGDSNLAVHGIVRWALTRVFPSQLWLHLKP